MQFDDSALTEPKNVLIRTYLSLLEKTHLFKDTVYYHHTASAVAKTLTQEQSSCCFVLGSDVHLFTA